MAADTNVKQQWRSRSGSPYKERSNCKSVLNKSIAHAAAPRPGNSVSPGTVLPCKGDTDPGEGFAIAQALGAVGNPLRVHLP